MNTSIIVTAQAAAPGLHPTHIISAWVELRRIYQIPPVERVIWEARLRAEQDIITVKREMTAPSSRHE